MAEAKRGKVIENQKEAFARPGLGCVNGANIGGILMGSMLPYIWFPVLR